MPADNIHRFRRPRPHPTKNPQEPHLLPSQRLVHSVDEAAEMLGIGRTLAYDLIRTGQLPSVKIGQRRLVARQDLDDFVEALRASGESA